MGRSGCPTKRGKCGGGGSPCKPKSFSFPLLLDKNITYSNNITYNKSYPIAKNLLICPIRKIPLNRFKSFAVKSFKFLPHQTTIFK